MRYWAMIRGSPAVDMLTRLKWLMHAKAMSRRTTPAGRCRRGSTVDAHRCFRGSRAGHLTVLGRSNFDPVGSLTKFRPWRT